MEFETVIGLETHVQLATASKMFCGSSAAYGGAPNEYTDPVTLGLPGALPVANRQAVEFAMMLCLALSCEIRRSSCFARKHYFYPDLPKGYQISQHDEPIGERGHLEIVVGEVTRTIGITRAHMEEDAGKNIHDAKLHASLVDFNRAGVPLIEIVSEPDLRSPAEAVAYLKTIRQLVRYLGISDGNMEEGSLRCDANISLRPVGSVTFGTRTEIKNINSFKFVESALEYEIARQSALLRAGTPIVQQTMLYDAEAKCTRPMRSKEASAEYRYFPDPDLPPVIIEQAWIHTVREQMPTLPQARFREFTTNLGLSSYDAGVLTAERSHADFFEAVFKVCGNAKAASNWVTSELFGLLNRDGKTLDQSPISPQAIGELIKLIDSDEISGKMAKQVFEEMFSSGRSPMEIVAARGLKQITDDSQIRGAITTVFAAHSAQLAQLVAGDTKLIGFFMGQVMKATQGNANPKKVTELLQIMVAEKKAAASKG